MQRQALIVGATGAVGSQLLSLCLDDKRYSLVTVVARRPAGQQHPKLRWIVSEFDALSELTPLPELAGGDAFCCLGTTIKAAGSAAAFRQVDYDFVLNAARFAKNCGVEHFGLVTAIGADSASRILYNRTKGDVEEAVANLSFPSLHIFRPSLLLGERREFRIKEEIGRWFSYLMTPLYYVGFGRYRPVKISRLADSILSSADQHRMTGSPRMFENNEI